MELASSPWQTFLSYKSKMKKSTSSLVRADLLFFSTNPSLVLPCICSGGGGGGGLHARAIVLSV